MTTTWQRDELHEVAELIKDIDICMFVTRADGAMEGRPMSNNGNVEFDGDSWFFSARESRKVEAIADDPRVELAYIATERGTWVSIEGHAQVVEDDERKRELWQDELEAWFPGGAEDDGVVLVKVNAGRVHAWTQGEELVIEPGKGVERIAQALPS
jgi:general stress protein 26